MPLALHGYCQRAGQRQEGIRSLPWSFPACPQPARATWSREGAGGGRGRFSKGHEAAPPVLGASINTGGFGFLPRACDHPSLCSCHGLVPQLVALRLARHPQGGCPLQNMFRYYLLTLLETWGFSLSTHSAPNVSSSCF